MRKKYLKKIRQSDLFWDKTDFAVSDFRKSLYLIQQYRVRQQVWLVFYTLRILLFFTFRILIDFNTLSKLF